MSAGAPRTIDGTSVVAIAVVEGSPYSIGAVAINGLSEDQRQAARDSLALVTGERYRPAGVAGGLDRLETDLRRQAYRQARVDVDTRVDAQAARVDVTVTVTPGSRSILRDVIVEGDQATRPVVARSIVLAPGAPLDPEAINETRRRLYDRDVYRSVDIEVPPLESVPAGSGIAPLEVPVDARIVLEQRPRYRVRYGLAVTDEEVGSDQRSQELGFAADVENRNLFGRGATVGASARLRRDQQVGRVSLGAKRLFALPIRSTVFVQREREQLDPDGAFPITSDISSLTAEQAYRVKRSVDLRYGYGIEKNHTFIRSDEADPFDLTVKIARFTTSGVADRRNDAFNPTRGWFTASTLELSTPGIGSDLKFLKDFTRYLPLRPGWTRACRGGGGPARARADVRWRSAHPERAVLRGRREQRARVPGGRARRAKRAGWGGRRFGAPRAERRDPLSDPSLVGWCGIRRCRERLRERAGHFIHQHAGRYRRRRPARYTARPDSIRPRRSRQSPIVRSQLALLFRLRARVLIREASPSGLPFTLSRVGGGAGFGSDRAICRARSA